MFDMYVFSSGAAPNLAKKNIYNIFLQALKVNICILFNYIFIKEDHLFQVKPLLITFQRRLKKKLFMLLYKLTKILVQYIFITVLYLLILFIIM